MISTTIIVPTHNQSGLLKRALGSIVRQMGRFDELVVVNNGSVAGTGEVVRTIQQQFPAAQVRHVWESEPGLLSGRHRGVLESDSELVVFVDDDVIVADGWLSSLRSAFQEKSVHLVGGPSRPLFETIPPKWLSTFVQTNTGGTRTCGYLSLMDAGKKPREIAPGLVWGLNFAIRRKTLIDLGGFHPDFTRNDLLYLQGDGEAGLTRKLERSGFRAMYVPRAWVYHFIPRRRLQPEYFVQRAFIQGVSDSYAAVRGGFDPLQTISTTNPPVGRSFVRLRDRVDRAHRAGIDFHQAALQCDPGLLDWVRRPNYWDYRLPVLQIDSDRLQRSALNKLASPDIA